MAEQRDNLNLSGQTDVRLSFDGDTFHGTTNCNGTQFHGGNFKNTVFEGPAMFNSAKFYSGADFTGAVFKDHADFENAEFYGGAVDFSDAVFLAGASFKNAKFGKPYPRMFGNWEIRFSREKGSDGREFHTLKIRKIGNAEEKWMDIDKFSISAEPNFSFNVRAWDALHEHRSSVKTAFKIFHESPQFASFAGCRFGEIKIDGFSKEEINEVIGKARTRIEEELIKKFWISEQEKEMAKKMMKETLKLFEDKYKENKFESLSSEQEKTAIMYILARHLEPTNLRSRCQHGENHHLDFSRAFFYPQGEVDFNKTLFFNGGGVEFDSATFGNGGGVGFGSATFSNGGTVVFTSASFSNGGSVGFNSASFGNGGDVWFFLTTFGNDGGVGFDSATFSNGTGVWFFLTTFGNDGGVGFDSATFSNGTGVWFDSVNFDNKGKIGLSKIVWINDGDLNFSNMAFRETLSLKFDECFFLCEGNISFKEARFPEKGSLMFQRCYFGRTPSVDFTGAVFRHTSFEGGEISWLKEDGETPEKILQGRLGGKYDDLSPTTQKELNTRTTPVFEKGTRVLWKDLTTESAKNLTLRRVNLSHSIFDGMTLSHIQLNAPEWFEKGKDKWWKIFKSERRILFEETTIEDAFNNGSNRENAENRRTYLNKLKNIGDQYTQLKNNLEKQGNYLDAGHFHYGEQEIRRKILKLEEGHRFHLFLSSFCKALSGYGERPRRALISTLTVIGLFSFILATLNINTNIGGLLSQEGLLEKGVAKLFKSCVELITPFSWSFSWKETATSWNDYWNKLDFIKGSRLFFLVGFQVFLFGIQLPLLVLAVRRRFKR